MSESMRMDMLRSALIQFWIGSNELRFVQRPSRCGLRQQGRKRNSWYEREYFGCRERTIYDEIQFVSEIQNPYVDNPDARISFIDVVFGFMQMKNAEVYVTVSNSRMFAKDAGKLSRHN